MVPHYMQSVSVTVYREYSETDQMEVHCTGLSSIRHEHEPKATVSFLVIVAFGSCLCLIEESPVQLCSHLVSL